MQYCIHCITRVCNGDKQPGVSRELSNCFGRDAIKSLSLGKPAHGSVGFWAPLKDYKPPRRGYGRKPGSRRDGVWGEVPHYPIFGGKGTHIYRGRDGRGRERAQGRQRDKPNKKKKRGKVKVKEGGFCSLLVCSPLPLSLQSCLKDEMEADVCSGLVTRAKRSPGCSPDMIPKGWLWKTLWDPMA